MKQENQYCTVEQGKKLREMNIEGSMLHHFKGAVRPEAWGDFYPAFSTSELGVMLPAYIYHSGVEYTLHCGKSKHGDFECGYIEVSVPLSGKYYIISNASTEASARGRLLIYLLENNHTTPEEVNTRLNNQ